MKKVLMVLMVVTMVMGFAAAASALNAFNCKGEPGNIICGSTGQDGTVCTEWDFETLNDYCTPGKKPNRAIFPVCDCIPDPFANVRQNQEYFIGMKILVDKHDGAGPVVGDNGVYWTGSEMIRPISVRTFTSQGEACKLNTVGNAYIGVPVSTGTFAGPFEYMLANGDTSVPTAGCVEDEDGLNRIVEFKTNIADGVGYTVTEQDDIRNASQWVIDIPEMWADFPVAKAGWTVYVKVCISETGEGDGVCADCESCCFDLKIGTLCCDSTPVVSTCSETLTFPYFTNTDGNWWNGMAVTNLTSKGGDAVVTVYENGDVYTDTVDIPANGIVTISFDALELKAGGTGDGIQGNERCYATVTSAFDMSGFAFMARETGVGVSMGYLAEKCGTCDCD